MPKCLNICQESLKIPFTFFLSYPYTLLSYRKFSWSCKISIRVKIIQGVRKHSNATSKEAMEESPLRSELAENRGNLEMTKITKESAAPCVSLRLDASPRNVPESGCRQRQIYGDNGTFFRKLSATTILSTGMFLAYRASLKQCLLFKV